MNKLRDSSEPKPTNRSIELRADDLLVFMIDHHDWPHGQPERRYGEWIAMKPDGSIIQFETERAALAFQKGWRERIAMIEEMIEDMYGEVNRRLDDNLEDE